MIIKPMLCLFVLMQSVKIGVSIKCYDCNSHNNSMCLDPTIYDQETRDQFLTLTDCRTHSAHEKYFCRKIVQTLLHKNHNSEVRVTRGCGWVPHHRDCYKADNEDHLETVCQCHADGCNHAPRVTTAVAALVVTALSVFLA